jgi:hypothetical protein
MIINGAFCLLGNLFVHERRANEVRTYHIGANAVRRALLVAARAWQTPA